MHKKKPKHCGHVAPITIRLYGNMIGSLSNRVMQTFESRITGFIWALRRDGSIVNEQADDSQGEISLAIDTEDDLTLKTMRRLPAYLSHQLPFHELASMRLKVLVYPTQDFQFWTPEENGDVIICAERGMFVDSVKSIWDVIAES